MSTSDVLAAKRLDQYVVGRLPEASRSFAARLIEEGHVEVNGQVIMKPGHKLKDDDSIAIDAAHSELAPIPEIELPIIYEDKTCVVIDKPVGLLSHSKGAFNPEATVATWLSSKVIGMDGDRAGIVHRLDRATSGVMICAKTPEALSWLQKQFSLRKTKKTYIAVVKGHLKPEQAIIDMAIERNPKKPQTFRVGINGKSASTQYKVLQSNDELSLVELKPTTGRTHQLRVHLEHLGHPIIGDTFYGGRAAPRLYLHARSLELTLPNKTRQVFEAEVPASFAELLR